jgi:hypothetical protein
LDKSKRAPGLFDILEENILLDFFNKKFEIISSIEYLFLKKLKYQNTSTKFVAPLSMSLKP